MTLSDILAHLDLSAAGNTPFGLKVGHVSLAVHAPEPLRSRLVAYFAETVAPAKGGAPVHLLEGQTLPAEPDWTDWAREAGKSGRKDAVFDLTGGRLIHKVRSGVTFVQAPGVAVALGPLAANESTVINFINAQVLNASLREGWQLTHAAAVTDGACTLAISGLSGGGKSTSILRMMNHSGTRFLSNDRVLIKGGRPAQALGNSQTSAHQSGHHSWQPAPARHALRNPQGRAARHGPRRPLGTGRETRPHHPSGLRPGAHVPKRATDRFLGAELVP